MAQEIRYNERPSCWPNDSFLHLLCNAQWIRYYSQICLYNNSSSLILIEPAGNGEALDEDGHLKDADDIVWYNDKDDTVPIALGSKAPRMFFIFIFSVFLYLYFGCLGTTSSRAHNTACMTGILEAEAQTSDTENKKKHRKQKIKAKEPDIDIEDNAEYVSSQSESSFSLDKGEESDKAEITNQEVISMLLTT